ncbi:hypothetical protein RHO15_05755 [Utexia brackfieldae]|uniref:MurR/RpiR family transcriptional regulator n=1 Tax=Utexia brackfieldae TaxID=3074108 RepID=UPI00370D5A08
MQPDSNLIERIKKSQPELSKAYQHDAHIIINNTFLASSMTIDELVKESDVSVATVNRFVHHCGYSGYPYFRLAMRELFNKLFEPAEKLSRVSHHLDTSMQTISDSLDNSIAQLIKTKAQLSEKYLEQAINPTISVLQVCLSALCMLLFWSAA